MPLYTITTQVGALSKDDKAVLAAQLTEMHASMAGVPKNWVHIGIEHFFEQFAAPLAARWKVLGSPELTSAVQAKLAAGLHDEVGSRSIAELEAQRDEVLLGLLELRKEADSVAVWR
jgi:phenylpyruvate tautomerase PptA (4-oxalocrotonate tautomerase family)